MLRFPAVIVLLFAASAAAALVATQSEGADRSRAVDGWLVEDRAESDGGRLVRLSRQAQGARIQYFVAFWRGNDGRVQGTLVERSDCTDGEEIGRHVILEASAVRAMLAGHLAGCGVAPRRIEAALGGFEPAYALALDWARDAEAATAAEAAAIAEYGNHADASDDMTVLDSDAEGGTAGNVTAPAPE